MNKVRLAAIALPLVAIFSLLLIAAIPGTGNDRESLGGEIRSQTAASAKGVGEGGYRYSNLLRLSPANNGAADVAEWEKTSVCVDTGAWQITISGDVNSISWRETPDSIVIVITGTVPDGDDASAPTY